jgi:hypothetical protein
MEAEAKKKVINMKKQRGNDQNTQQNHRIYVHDLHSLVKIPIGVQKIKYDC